MNNQNTAALSTNDLGPFLYADVAVENSGMELTLLSALARRGLDPWKEAARLAALPRVAATAELSDTLSALRIPNGPKIAGRLVGLLPSTVVKTGSKPGQPSRYLSTGWLMAAMVAGTLTSFFLTPKPPADTIAPASWFSEVPPAKDPGHPKSAPTQEAVKDAPATPDTPHQGNG